MMQNLLELIAQRRAELAREQLSGIGPITDEIRAAALRSAIDRTDHDPVAAETLRRVSEHESMGPPFRVLMAARAAKIAADKARRLEEAAATAIADPQRPRVPQGESKWPLTGYVDEWGKTQHVGDEIVDIALENNPIDLSPPALKPLPIASKAVSLPLQRLLKRLRNKDEDGMVGWGKRRMRATNASAARRGASYRDIACCRTGPDADKIPRQFRC